MSASRQLPAQIRDLNSEPDPQEPAYSYDDGVFYHPAEEMEDEFHERLAAAHYNNGNGSGNNRRVNSGGSDVCNSITSHSSSITGNGRNAGGSSSNSLNRSSGGSQTNNITNISLLPATDLTATTGGSGIQSLQREKQHLPTSAFWRTNKNNNTSSSVTSEANGSSNRTEQPAFSSVSFRDHPEEGSEVRNNKHNGRTISLLSNSLRQQAFGGNNSNSSISGNSPRPQSVRFRPLIMFRINGSLSHHHPFHCCLSISINLV